MSDAPPGHAETSDPRGAGFMRFAAVFAGGTMISRITGLARDIIFTAIVPSQALGSFLFAFSLPNMLRDMLGEGASNAAVVPVLSERKVHEGEEGYRRALEAILGSMLLVFILITIVAILLMPLAPRLLNALTFFTGRALPQQEEDLRHLVRVMQWTFPYFIMICMAAIMMGPLFIRGRYAVASWSPSLLNVAFIAACVVLIGKFHQPTWGLVTGLWIGGLLQLGAMWWDLARSHGPVIPRPALRDPAFRRVLALLVPVTIGQSAGEVNKLVDRFFAMSLGEDKVLALYLSNRLVQLPLAMFGVAVSVALLPELSRLNALGRREETRRLLMKGFSQTLFLIGPAMCVLIALREPLVRLLFERGAFTEEATRLSSDALFYASLGLVSFAWLRMANQGFYADHDTRTPVMLGALSMGLNIALNMILVRPMGYLGLALSTSVCYTVNFVLLYVFLWRRYGALATPRWIARVGGIVLASIAAGAGGWLCWQAWAAEISIPGTIGRAMGTLLSLAVSGIVYLAACAAMRHPDLREFLAGLRRRAAR
ncbi:MAG: murein biosynthesis integral membrane protein MurJ [Candidatus Hydrogenedentes bacterium]|nr:murein biosynthesis integral membrane protein MurJ [Candidatus Hydrogenedentota bacterium]